MSTGPDASAQREGGHDKGERVRPTAEATPRARSFLEAAAEREVDERKARKEAMRVPRRLLGALSAAGGSRFDRRIANQEPAEQSRKRDLLEGAVFSIQDEVMEVVAEAGSVDAAKITISETDSDVVAAIRHAMVRPSAPSYTKDGIVDDYLGIINSETISPTNLGGDLYWRTVIRRDPSAPPLHQLVGRDHVDESFLDQLGHNRD